MHNLVTDPRVWISVLALVVSGFSAFVSWRSGKNAARALAISENQEKRRQPKVEVYVVSAYYQRAPKRQLFRVLVSVSNPTDINNSVVRAELRVTYPLTHDIDAVCRLPHNPVLEDGLSTESNVFSLPMRVDAHQTSSGSFLFALEDDVIGKAIIDGHNLILEDTHGLTTNTELAVRELIDENKKQLDPAPPSSRSASS